MPRARAVHRANRDLHASSCLSSVCALVSKCACLVPPIPHSHRARSVKALRCTAPRHMVHRNARCIVRCAPYP
eukprot:12306498-Alexandrium_andersonii.AAC.1